MKINSLVWDLRASAIIEGFENWWGFRATPSGDLEFISGQDNISPKSRCYSTPPEDAVYISYDMVSDVHLYQSVNMNCLILMNISNENEDSWIALVWDWETNNPVKETDGTEIAREYGLISD